MSSETKVCRLSISFTAFLFKPLSRFVTKQISGVVGILLTVFSIGITIVNCLAYRLSMHAYNAQMPHFLFKRFLIRLHFENEKHNFQ